MAFPHASVPRDGNRNPSLFGVSNADLSTPVPIAVDPATNRMLVNTTGGGGGGAVTIADGANVVEGATTDTAVTSDANGTLSGKLRGLVKILADIWDSANHRIKVDGSGVTQPVSAASLPLPTLAATSTKQSDGSQKTQIVDGSGNVIASTSNSLNVSLQGTGSVSNTPSSGSTSGTITSNSSSITTGGLSGQSAFAVVSVQGTYAGVSFGITVSNDGGSTYFNVPIYDTYAMKWLVPGSTITPGTNASKTYWIPINPNGSNVKVLASAYTSGTANVQITFGGGNIPPAQMSHIWDAAGNSRGANVTSANALVVDGSAVTQPVSAASLPLPSNAAQETGGNLATIVTNTGNAATSANQTNGTQQTKITDGTNLANILKSDGTAAGQNAQLVAGTGYTTATLTLNSGSPNTAWFDMLNFAWWSVEILTNTTPATLTFQTSGDASETNVSSASAFNANATNSTGIVTTTTSASATYHGPRTGRYFRISSNNGAGTTTLVLTFFTNPSAMNTYGGTTVGSKDATAASVPASAFYQGLIAKTALPTATSDGQLTGEMGDKFGRQVVLPGTVRDLIGTQTTTISASTSETTIVTAAASVFNDLLMLICSNTSATAARIDFRDTTAGTVLFSIYVPAGDVRGFSLGGVVIPQTSVNTNWTAQSSASVTDLRIYAVFAKNK